MQLSYVATVFGLVQLLYFFLLARHVPLSGDEIWYFESSKLIPALIGQAICLDFRSAGRTIAELVDHGWFMPGMSILLAPVTFLTDSIAIVRLYLGALNFGVVVTILFAVQKQFGGRAPVVYLLCCLVVPYFSLYCFAIWGDLIAAHLLLYLVFFVFNRPLDSGSRGFVLGLRVGAALGAITLLRGFYWMFAPLFVAMFAAATPAGEPLWVRFRIAAAPSAALVLALTLVLAWWSVEVTRFYGFHLTTTSTTLSRITLFGSPDYFKSVWQDDCGPKNTSPGYFDPKNSSPDYASGVSRDVSVFYNYVYCRATARHRSYAQQVEIELTAAMAGVSFGRKARLIAVNLGEFFLNSEYFLNRFAQISNPSTGYPPREWRESVFKLLMQINYWGWRVIAALGLALLLIPIAPSINNLYLSTIYKYCVLLYSTHPFMVEAHGRYYVEYIPFIAAAVAAAGSRKPASLFRLNRLDDRMLLPVVALQVAVPLIALALAISYLAAA